ncbi:MAG: GAF domain-containing SpoIIE family protein phosphatase [Marmoricola sp.]
MRDEPASSVDESFDRYARLARRLLDVPVALVSLVEAERQVFPGASGLPEPYRTTRETPLSHSFCQYVVKDRRPLVIADARADDRLSDNLAVEELDVIAYAGWPLTDAGGRIIGSLCAIDTRPRVWTEHELEGLADLAAACSAELAQRELQQQAETQARAARITAHRDQILLALSEALATTRTLRDISVSVERAARELMVCAHAGIWVRETADPAEIAAPAMMVPGDESEPLNFVHNASTDWAQASTHAVLGIDRTNPLGEVLLDDSPLYFVDKQSMNQRYPHLATPVQVGEARAFAPLAVGGRSYGGLALVWPESREFSEEDRVAVAALTVYTSQAVQRALLLQERVDVAMTLQRAMMTRLPQPDGLQLAARYRPAAVRDQVGGDWYDAVEMSSGETSLMIGDVVGHDIVAASVMGQLRSMLRAFAWALDERPSRNVERLDRATLHMDHDTLATLLYARIEPPSADDSTRDRTLRWTNAGHLPPVLVDAHGVARLLDDGRSADCMLGVVPDRPRRDQTASISAGSTLLLFTDGLFERRDETITQGLERVRGVAARHHSLPLGEFLDATLEELVCAPPDDDVAVLAVRLTPAAPRVSPRQGPRRG